MTDRFSLVQDRDCHWFVIPVARQQEWDAWCDLSEDDERAWDAPDFAKPTGGSYSLLTFTDPVIE